MTEFLNDLNKKSDEELISIANGKIPYFLSAKSTTTSQDIIDEAKAILHKRQNKEKSWHEKPWGKILIGVIIGLILLVITLYANRYLQKDQSQDRATSNRELVKVIDNYMGGEGIQVAPPGIVQASFNPDSNKADFYAKVTSGDNEYILAFANKPDGYENIYYNKLKEGFWEVKHITINKRSYLICCQSKGSAGVLYMSIYSYDGIGKMKEVFKKGELFWGGVFVGDNKIYVSGNNRKYKITFHNGKFSLDEYKERVKPLPELGTHVLSHYPQGKFLKVLFDNKEIKFQKTREDAYDSEETIEIKLDEQILYDDNVTGYPPQHVRLLTEYPMFDSRGGFFMTLKPTKVGETSIHLDNNYKESYSIRFRITK